MASVISRPSDITLQEQVLVWAIMAMDNSAPTQAVLERPNLTSFNVEYQIIKAPDGQQLFVGRVVIPMNDPSTLADGDKPWLAATAIPQSAAIPAYYSTN